MDAKTLLKLIRSGKVGRDRAIEFLFLDELLKKKIRNMLFSKGGKEEHVHDILVNAILEFVKSVVRKPELIVENYRNYITGIGKYEWYARLRKDGKMPTDNIDDQPEPTTDYTPESNLIDLDKKDLIQKLLDFLGAKCKEVLLLWANGYSMREIAKIMGYKSEGMAKKKKYQCFKGLGGFLDDNPDLGDLLK